MLNFNFSEKGVGLLDHILRMILQEECFSCYNLLTGQLTRFYCLIALTSQDIGQYIYNILIRL